jgi:hypothetical protein
MRLLHKITLPMIFVFNSIPVICLENISELVTSLTEPKAVAPKIQQTTVQETDEPASSATTPKVNAPDDLVVAPTVEPKVEPIEPVEPKTEPVAPIEPKIVTPEVPKVMPTVSVSPVQPENQAKIMTPGIAPKMITAPTPIVSRSISSPVQIVDVPDDEQKGLDTLNIDSSGNWLEKRIWYQKAEQLFEVIRTNLQKTSDLRMKFVNEVNQVGHKIDDFYESISFEKGQIDEMLTAVLQDLANQEQIRGGDLSSSERSIKSKVQVEQKHFEVLSKDLKLIEDLDEQIDKTMMKAFKEIDSCRGLETRAWNNFKEIGQELDDKKARVSYYQMENFHKNIEQKMTYLQNNLLPYLQSQLVSKVDETMTQIKTAVQAFDTKGLNLNTILQKDEHGDLLILKQRDEAQEQEAQKAKMMAEAQAKEAQAKAKAEIPTWYCNVWCTFIAFIQPVLVKLHEWFCIGLCFIQSIFCKIQEWICRLLGY